MIQNDLTFLTHTPRAARLARTVRATF
jgi:hypothetical protein